MKKLFGILILIITLVSCSGENEKKAPIYTGMTAHLNNFNDNESFSYQTEINRINEEQSKIGLNCPLNTDFYLFIHINNPLQYEIMSFILNDIKYQSYQFDKASTSTVIVLRVDGNAEEKRYNYYIESIKYILDEDIFDVNMKGNKSIDIIATNERELQYEYEINYLKSNEFRLEIIFKNYTDFFKDDSEKIELLIYDGTTIIHYEYIYKQVDFEENDKLLLWFSKLDPGKTYEVAIVGNYTDIQTVPILFHLNGSIKITLPDKEEEVIIYTGMTAHLKAFQTVSLLEGSNEDSSLYQDEINRINDEQYKVGLKCLPNTDYFLYIYIDNPSQCEVLSLIVNDVEYLKGQFWKTTSNTTIVLKIDGKEVLGLYNYIITSIKYISHNEVLEAIIEGNSKVEVLVVKDRELQYEYEIDSITSHDVEMEIKVLNYIDFFKDDSDELQFLIYDVSTKCYQIYKKNFTNDEKISVIFSGLDPGKTYEIVIVGKYKDVADIPPQLHLSGSFSITLPRIDVPFEININMVGYACIVIVTSCEYELYSNEYIYVSNCVKKICIYKGSELIDTMTSIHNSSRLLDYEVDYIVKVDFVDNDFKKTYELNLNLPGPSLPKNVYFPQLFTTYDYEIYEDDTYNLNIMISYADKYNLIRIDSLEVYLDDDLISINNSYYADYISVSGKIKNKMISNIYKIIVKYHYNLLDGNGINVDTYEDYIIVDPLKGTDGNITILYNENNWLDFECTYGRKKTCKLFCDNELIYESMDLLYKYRVLSNMNSVYKLVIECENIKGDIVILEKEFTPYSDYFQITSIEILSDTILEKGDDFECILYVNNPYQVSVYYIHIEGGIVEILEKTENYIRIKLNPYNLAINSFKITDIYTTEECYVYFFGETIINPNYFNLDIIDFGALNGKKYFKIDEEIIYEIEFDNLALEVLEFKNGTTSFEFKKINDNKYYIMPGKKAYGLSEIILNCGDDCKSYKVDLRFNIYQFDNNYNIYSIQDLMGIGNSQGYNGYNSYNLMTDLDLRGVAWESFNLSGFFFGNNHTISNLRYFINDENVINRPEIGVLFTSVNGVENLNLLNVYIDVYLKNSDEARNYNPDRICILAIDGDCFENIKITATISLNSFVWVLGICGARSYKNEIINCDVQIDIFFISITGDQQANLRISGIRFAPENSIIKDCKVIIKLNFEIEFNYPLNSINLYHNARSEIKREIMNCEGELYINGKLIL